MLSVLALMKGKHSPSLHRVIFLFESCHWVIIFKYYDYYSTYSQEEFQILSYGWQCGIVFCLSSEWCHANMFDNKSYHTVTHLMIFVMTYHTSRKNVKCSSYMSLPRYICILYIITHRDKQAIHIVKIERNNDGKYTGTFVPSQVGHICWCFPMVSLVLWILRSLIFIFCLHWMSIFCLIFFWFGVSVGSFVCLQLCPVPVCIFWGCFLC